MHRTLAILICLLITTASRAEETTVRKLRLEFRSKVIKALGLRFEKLDTGKSIRRASMIARETFGPHTELLKAEARREMSRLTQITEEDLQPYKKKIPEMQDVINDTLGTYQSDGPHLGIMYLDGWSVRTVAERAKQFIVPRMTPVKEMANRTMLEKFVDDVYYRLNDDYTKPVVVIKSLDEVFLVTLEMDPETGIYQPVKLDWLKKKRKR